MFLKDKMVNSFRKEWLRFLLLILLASLFLFYKIDKPFFGHHDYNGAVSGVVARNYIENIGRFLNINAWQNIDNIYNKTIIFYPHYPPLSFLLFTLSGMIFGVNEVSLRLVTVVSSLVMIVFIYKIGEKLYNKKTGILASFLAIVTPMFIYFGKTPDHEPILTAFSTAAFYFYILANDRNKKVAVPFFIFLGLALFESWASFFFLFFLLIHAILYKWVSRKMVMIMVGMAAGVVLLQLLLIFFFQGPEAIVGVLQYGIYRMNGNPALSSVNFTVQQFFSTILRYFIIYFTRILMFFSLLWLFNFLRSWRNNNPFGDKFLIIIFLYPAVFTLVFRNLMYIHDFKFFLFLPFIVLSAAKVITDILGKIHVFSDKNRKYFIGLATILIVALVYFERLPYLKTLLISSFDKPGYEVGNLIKTKLEPQETALLNSREFGEFYRVFVEFYSNRHIIYEDMNLEEYRGNMQKYDGYRYIIFVEGRPIDKNLEYYLLKNYSSEKMGIYTFVDISINK